MTTLIICNKCGKPIPPIYSDGTGQPTPGYCVCQPSTGWGGPTAPYRVEDELSQLRTSNRHLLSELDRLRADHKAQSLELEQERYQRAQAQSHAASLGNTVQRHYDVVAEMGAEADRLRAALAEAERERDEARGDAGAWKKRYFDAGRSEDAFAADMARLMVDVFKKDETLLKERDAATEKTKRSRRTIRALVVAFRIVWYCVINEYPRAKDTIKRLIAERGQAGKE